MARDVFVPLRYTTNMFTASPCVNIPMALVSIRVALAPWHAAFAVGIARGALDILTIAATKRAAMNPSQRLATDTVFQHALALL